MFIVLKRMRGNFLGTNDAGLSSSIFLRMLKLLVNSLRLAVCSENSTVFLLGYRSSSRSFNFFELVDGMQILLGSETSLVWKRAFRLPNL